MAGMLVMIIVCSTYAVTSTNPGPPPCDPLKNEYYLEQADECFACETCPVGFGKVPLKESTINFNSVNGPSACIECRPCRENFYSDVSAYHCKPCTDCQLIGRYEIQPCNREQDSVCSDKSPIPRKQEETTEQSEVPTYKTALTVIVVVVVFVVIVSTAFFIYRRKCRNSNISTTRNLQRQDSYGSTASVENIACDDLEQTHVTNAHDEYSSADECSPLLAREQKQLKRISRKRHHSYNLSETTNDFTPKPRGRSHSCSALMNSVIKTPKILKQQLSTDQSPEQYSARDRFKFVNQYNPTVANKIRQWDKACTPKKDIHRTYKFLPVAEFISGLQLSQDKDLVLLRIKKWETQQVVQIADELSSESLLMIAKVLAPGYKYRQVARAAGLSTDGLDIIQQDFRDDSLEQSCRVLEKLKRTNKIRSKDDIIKLLRKIDHSDLIKKILLKWETCDVIE